MKDVRVLTAINYSSLNDAIEPMFSGIREVVKNSDRINIIGEDAVGNPISLMIEEIPSSQHLVLQKKINEILLIK